ncbi:hypothetical protein, partial [uncultured Fusobacterium sp.]|uniref:hypothetical protein n=1 Tax=uncultured Fusobacterium sp. TaxID=159267 RepID=UPI0025E5C783
FVWRLNFIRKIYLSHLFLQKSKKGVNTFKYQHQKLNTLNKKWLCKLIILIINLFSLFLLIGVLLKFLREFCRIKKVGKIPLFTVKPILSPISFFINLKLSIYNSLQGFVNYSHSIVAGGLLEIS